MVSSIQLSEKTKMELQSIKKSNSESYEDVIKRLLKDNSKKVDYELLKEGYIANAKMDLEIAKECENVEETENESWEWKE